MEAESSQWGCRAISPRFLAWGVTSVRDTHGGLASLATLKRRSSEGPPQGPRVYPAGAMIDGLPATYPDAIGVNNESEARKAVDRLVSAGAEFVKVYTRIDPPLLRAIVDEARAFNLAVTGHLGMTDALTAAKAGITSIEHLTGVPESASPNASSLFTAHYRGFFPGWTAFERSWAGLDSAALTRVATRLADAKILLVPTLVLHEALSRLDEPGQSRDPGLQDVPEAQQREWDVRGLIARAGWTEPTRTSSFDSLPRPADGLPPEPTPPTRCWYRATASIARWSFWSAPA